MNIDGYTTAWLKHQQLFEIKHFPPVDQSDKAMVLKGYDSWEFYQHVNIPLHESQQVNGLFAHQQMFNLNVNVSELLNDSPAKHFNELQLQKLRDEALSQVVQKLYYSRNVFDDASHDCFISDGWNGQSGIETPTTPPPSPPSTAGAAGVLSASTGQRYVLQATI